jgi:hypothetical protein
MTIEPPLVVDADIVPDGDTAPASVQEVPLTHLERFDPVAQGTIIRAEEPEEILAKAGKIANALADLVRAQDLSRNMGGKKEHVEVGAWQALGSLLAAFGGTPLHADPAWHRPVTNPDGSLKTTTYHVKETRKKWGKVDGQRRVIEEIESEYDVEGIDWEARVEIKTPDGVVVGAAEAMCSRAEFGWMSKPDPAVRSMAETRAESRAYRRAVGWIMIIAGYNPTPAEEMPATQAEQADPFGPPADGKLIEQIERAVAYTLDQSSPDPKGDAVKRVMQAIHSEAGYYPRAVLLALGRVGKELLEASKATNEHDVARAEHLAAEHQRAQEKPAPGTVDPPVLRGESEEKDLQALTNAGCCCPGPLSERFAWDCPIKGHGIPRDGDDPLVL